MESDSDKESLEGDINPENEPSNWGKTKYDYYYTDYVDKDYPSKLTAKEERLASIEQEEALRIQRKLLSTLEDVDLQITYEDDAPKDDQDDHEDVLESIERHNKSLDSPDESKKRKRVSFKDTGGDEGEPDEDSDNIVESEASDDDSQDDERTVVEEGRARRPINVAIKKNRGLTPYKKKEYRNPRVKHKLKYKKAMSKRRRNVKEVQTEFHRYSGETTGIKTGTVKSIKLC